MQAMQGIRVAVYVAVCAAVCAAECAAACAEVCVAVCVVVCGGSGHALQYMHICTCTSMLICARMYLNTNLNSSVC